MPLIKGKKTKADSSEGSDDALPQRRAKRTRKQVQSPDEYKPGKESEDESASIDLSEGDLDSDSSYEKKKKKRVP